MGGRCSTYKCLCTQVKYIGRFLRGGRGMLASFKKKKKNYKKKSNNYVLKGKQGAGVTYLCTLS